MTIAGSASSSTTCGWEGRSSRGGFSKRVSSIAPPPETLIMGTAGGPPLHLLGGGNENRKCGLARAARRLVGLLLRMHHSSRQSTWMRDLASRPPHFSATHDLGAGTSSCRRACADFGGPPIGKAALGVRAALMSLEVPGGEHWPSAATMSRREYAHRPNRRFGRPVGRANRIAVHRAAVERAFRGSQRDTGAGNACQGETPGRNCQDEAARRPRGGRRRQPPSCRGL